MTLAPGNAFWILGRESNRTFSTGPATTLDTSEPHIKIQTPGWNLVSNPYSFPLPTENVTSTDRTDNPQDGPIDVRSYDGSWTTHTGDWMPFEGYAVFNLGGLADTLRFYSDASNIPTPVAAKRGGSMDWQIEVSATKGRARDADNVAVLAPGSSSGWDHLDKPEPPVIGDYVSVWFEGERWPLAVDARPTGEFWPIVVTSATSGVVNLSFKVPSAVRAHLFDPTTGTTHDLTANPTYSVVSAGNGSKRRLELYGRAGQAPVPSSFGIAPVFPNPSTGAITLTFRLPEQSRVEVTLLDVLGRKVATLANAPYSAGEHLLVWDGTNVPPGLYIARLRAAQGLRSTLLTLTR
jgi:hypothetical protein